MTMTVLFFLPDTKTFPRPHCHPRRTRLDIEWKSCCLGIYSVSSGNFNDFMSLAVPSAPLSIPIHP